MRSSANAVATFEPTDDRSAELVDFVAALEARGKSTPQPGARLVGRDGKDVELPDALYRVLLFAAENLAAGRAISIAPIETLLTTQEAAEFLGMSRPSLIKRLEREELAYSLVGRHRRIRLGDLMDYQHAQADSRRKALDEMVAIAVEHDLYEATAVPAEGIR